MLSLVCLIPDLNFMMLTKARIKLKLKELLVVKAWGMFGQILTLNIFVSINYLY